MEQANKISVDEIIYLLTDENSLNEKHRNRLYRLCMRAIEDLCTYAALEDYEEVKAIADGQIEMNPDYMYFRMLQVEGVSCYSTEQAFQLFGETSSTGSYFVYSIRNGKILFEKPYASIEGKAATLSYKVISKDESGNSVIPRTIQEPVIAFVDMIEAKSTYKNSGGRMGRGLFQDMERRYERLKDDFHVEIESSGEAELTYLSMIWNTKKPLSALNYYKKGKKDL